ncbi:unnamed protein product [Pleuronectes platessa]|uniref:Uncharacterized protein n=1 Tax=Pleuronectes platessa TaxID=8262 RepID=A0A9N7W421_PLEPL|nr:unnamed protein product [Pleuronectes platessa]
MGRTTTPLVHKAGWHKYAVYTAQCQSQISACGPDILVSNQTSQFDTPGVDNRRKEKKQMQQSSRAPRDEAERRPLKARHAVGPPIANELRCGGTQTAPQVRVIHYGGLTDLSVLADRWSSRGLADVTIYP